jgi:hypothetical protein
VTERLFSLLFHGFISYLEAVQNKSERRAQAGDVNHPPILFFFFSLMTLPIGVSAAFSPGNFAGEKENAACEPAPMALQL